MSPILSFSQNTTMASPYRVLAQQAASTQLTALLLSGCSCEVTDIFRHQAAFSHSLQKQPPNYCNNIFVTKSLQQQVFTQVQMIFKTSPHAVISNTPSKIFCIWSYSVSIFITMCYHFAAYHFTNFNFNISLIFVSYICNIHCDIVNLKIFRPISILVPIAI